MLLAGAGWSVGLVMAAERAEVAAVLHNETRSGGNGDRRWRIGARAPGAQRQARGPDAEINNVHGQRDRGRGLGTAGLASDASGTSRVIVLHGSPPGAIKDPGPVCQHRRGPLMCGYDSVSLSA